MTLGNAPPAIPDHPSISPEEIVTAVSYVDDVDMSELEEIIERSRNKVRYEGQKKMLAELQESVEARKVQPPKALEYRCTIQARKIIQEYSQQCRKHYEDVYQAIVTALDSFDDDAKRVACQLGMGPRSGPRHLLSYLDHTNRDSIPDDWKLVFLTFAAAIVRLDFAKRLERSIDSPLGLAKELEKIPYKVVTLDIRPDDILLEADCAITMWEEQKNVVDGMVNPSAKQHNVRQQDMGKGKTSTSMPSAAAALADKKKLARVIVRRAQLCETLELFQTRLGGLLRRRVHVLPFSRNLKLTPEDCNRILTFIRGLQADGGILVMLPEHLMSLRLMVLDRKNAGQSLLGTKLAKIDEYFRLHSQDIMDEADEQLNVKLRLVFPCGAQQPTDFSPHRWDISFHILEAVIRFAQDTQKQFPLAANILHHGQLRFPAFSTLISPAEEALMQEVAEYVCQQCLPTFAGDSKMLELKDKAFDFVMGRVASEEWVASLSVLTQKFLRLCHKLLHRGVLSFILTKKGWRTTYGFDNNRRPLTSTAVPFSSKDRPVPSAEFSDPDVRIILTLIGYYEKGLSSDELRQAFEHLIHSNTAHEGYQAWVEDVADPSASLRDLTTTASSIHDKKQWEDKVYPQFQFSRHAAKYHLFNFVFPKEMRECPWKLTASPGDLLEGKVHPTAGFSGTKETKELFPLDVDEVKLSSEAHTDADVLLRILSSKNAVASMSQEPGDTTSASLSLLGKIVGLEDQCSVIIDVGAQLFDMSNEEIAREWLGLVKDTQISRAAVFVNAQGEVSVIDRQNCVQRLANSPFEGKPDQYLVLYDQANSRGRDIKLAPDARAAVLLRQDLPKDDASQAVMRLRQFGQTQSATFCVSPQVVRQLPNKVVSLGGIIEWLITNSLTRISETMPQWQDQELRRVRHRIYRKKDKPAEDYLEQTSGTLLDDGRSNLATIIRGPTYDRILSRCQSFGIETGSGLDAIQQCEQEQERELSVDVEQELHQEVENQIALQPHVPEASQELRLLGLTGLIDFDGATSVVPAFQSLEDTSTRRLYDASKIASGLYVTADFHRTVKTELKAGGTERLIMDEYKRPVQFVISGQQPNGDWYLIIPSPFEVQQLGSIIRTHKKITLHVFYPRKRLSSKSLDTLELFTIGKTYSSEDLPVELRLQLILFSDQTYLESEAMAGKMEKWIQDHKGCEEFLKALLSNIRCHGGDISRSHVGKLLVGKKLVKEDFAT